MAEDLSAWIPGLRALWTRPPRHPRQPVVEGRQLEQGTFVVLITEIWETLVPNAYPGLP